MPETLEIPLEDLRGWLEQETTPILEPLKAEGKNILDEVGDRLGDMREICEKLSDKSEEEMLKSNPKTYRRAREVYRLVNRILETIDEVVVPKEVSQESIEGFCQEYKQALSTVGRERGKRYPRISPYFIIDRRRVDTALRRAFKSSEKLESFLSDEYVKAKAVEDAFSMINKLVQLRDELSELEKGKKKMELKKESLDKKTTDTRQRIELIEEKSDMGALNQINQKIGELREEVKHSFRYFQKPFLKFQTLVRDPSYSLPSKETKKLNEYMDEPFTALATEDEGYPLLKRILQRMNDAITQGRMKLKSSRLRKAQKQMNDILLGDTLTPLHRSCREALTQRQRLLTSGAVVSSQDKLAQFQNDLRELRKRRELITSRGTRLGAEYNRMMEKIKNQKRELEDAILEVTDKNIQATW